MAKKRELRKQLLAKLEGDIQNMMEKVTKHFHCGKGNTGEEESGGKSKKNFQMIRRLFRISRKTSKDHIREMQKDALEEEWSNSPKSRLRRNAFDIPYYG